MASRRNDSEEFKKFKEFEEFKEGLNTAKQPSKGWGCVDKAD